MKKIIVTISPEGKISVEAEGYAGNSCVEATRFLKSRELSRKNRRSLSITNPYLKRMCAINGNNLYPSRWKNRGLYSDAIPLQQPGNCQSSSPRLSLIPYGRNGHYPMGKKYILTHRENSAKMGENLARCFSEGFAQDRYEMP